MVIEKATYHDNQIFLLSQKKSPLFDHQERHCSIHGRVSYIKHAHAKNRLCGESGFFHNVLSMAMPNMKLIGEFMTQLEMPQAFWKKLYKMAASGHFIFPIDAKNHRVLVIWDLNGYGEYEFDRCICDKVMACTSIGVRWKRGRR